MPLKRTPTKNKKVDKHSANRASEQNEATLNASALSVQTPTDATLNKSASENDLATIRQSTFEYKTPPDYVSKRIKRGREQMEDSLSTQLSDFQAEIKNLFTSFTSSQSNELKNLNTQLKEIQLTNQNIELSVTFLTAQNEEFRQRITDLEIQTKKDRDYITILENKLEEIQSNNRKSSFEIRNVPKLTSESKEDLIDIAINISNSIECKILKTDINDIYRLKPKSGHTKNTPIIVDMNSTILKNNVMKSAKSFNVKHRNSKLCAEHAGLKKQENTPIYLCEHLTPKASQLYFLARDLTKTKKYKFCWTAYGKVFVRENEQTPILQIYNENQIHKLLSSTQDQAK